MSNKRLKLPLYVIASLLFGVKTYIVYRFMFNIEIENFMQEFILFLNPFISAFLIFSLSVWFKSESRQLGYIRFTALIGTIILFVNLVFYRNFTDFITVPQLFQSSNMVDLGSSILSLIKPYDLFLFLDIVFIWYLSKRKQNVVAVKYPRSGRVFTLVLSLGLLTGNFFLAEMERPELFTRAFDREYLVKNIGLFNYHVYDVFMHSKVKSQRLLADGNDIPDIKSYISENIRSNEDSELFGVAENKNIIFIFAESVQNFVINNQVNDEEITPFMNQLTKDKDTYYFDNFYHQTEQGKTSDAEFLVENSLYPLSRGAVFFTNGQNEYHGLSEVLKENGYYTSVFHANNKSFWNRDQMYDSLGVDEFFDIDSYEVTQGNSVGWGLKDKEYFKQSIKHMESIEEPFYGKFITLTNHFPFELDDEDQSIEPYDSNSATLNNYFPTVRYTDEAIEEFFEQLKQTDLYDDSIIIIMGDHYGISANHNKSMSQYLDKEEITPYDHIELQKVPFFIHIPGHGEGETISKVSGQIDVKPTILHMAGIHTNHDLYFGNDLFHNDRKDFIVFRNGDFISEDNMYTSGMCYNRDTGEPIINDETDVSEEECLSLVEEIEKELMYSDNIIYGDLFRFIDFN